MALTKAAAGSTIAAIKTGSAPSVPEPTVPEATHAASELPAVPPVVEATADTPVAEPGEAPSSTVTKLVRPRASKASAAPWHLTLARRGIEDPTKLKKLHLSLPAPLFTRIMDYEDAVLARTDKTVVRATLVAEALRELPEEWAAAAKWQPSTEDMDGPRVPFEPRVPTAMFTKMKQMISANRREHRGLSMNTLGCTALARLMPILEADLDRHDPA